MAKRDTIPCLRLRMYVSALAQLSVASDDHALTFREA